MRICAQNLVIVGETGDTASTVSGLTHSTFLEVTFKRPLRLLACSKIPPTLFVLNANRRKRMLVLSAAYLR